MKRCSKCGRELDESQFYAHSAAIDGLQSWCKECQKTQRLSKKTAQGLNPELEKFTPRELIAELKARGYTGELKYTHTIKL